LRGNVLILAGQSLAYRRRRDKRSGSSSTLLFARRFALRSPGARLYFLFFAGAGAK
jgi:hypothetical protein